MVVGDFNTNLAAPEGQVRDKEIAAAMDAVGLEDLSGHLLPRNKPWFRDSMMWCMRRGFWKVRSQTNYFLGTDRRML